MAIFAAVEAVHAAEVFVVSGDLSLGIFRESLGDFPYTGTYPLAFA